ncbi:MULTISPECIES: lipoprotein [Paenibacillus]
MNKIYFMLFIVFILSACSNSEVSPVTKH